MSAPSSAHILASFAFVTPQILICVGVIMETTNRRAFGRACHSVTAVHGFWMPLGRAARECRPYLSSAQIQHCRASVSAPKAFGVHRLEPRVRERHRRAAHPGERVGANESNTLQYSHYSSLVWIVIRYCLARLRR